MPAELPAASAGVTPAPSSDTTDACAQLKLPMCVLGTHGKVLGTVDRLDLDVPSGRVTAFVIRHAWHTAHRTAVPASHVQWVNEHAVMLDLLPSAFKQLPRLAPTWPAR